MQDREAGRQKKNRKKENTQKEKQKNQRPHISGYNFTLSHLPKMNLDRVTLSKL